MKNCIMCGKNEVNKILDLKSQPICNRFVVNPKENEYLKDMALAQCNGCGLIQLDNLVPVKELQPRYNWITYKEPEGHLDKIAQEMSVLPGLTKESKILAISFKDDSLVERMKKLGFSNTYRIDPISDLGITNPGLGVETIQEKLDQIKAREIVKKHGKADVVIFRHILEHTYGIHKFTDSIKELVSENGYTVIEVPDCCKSLDALDYTIFWEEHTMYFTPVTFKNYFMLNNLNLNYFEIFPYKLENSLVGIAQFKKNNRDLSFDQKILEEEKYRAQKFGKSFQQEKKQINQIIGNFSKTKGNLALFGAGHLGCTFINLFELNKYITCILDDQPNKQGLYMPGTKLPIYGSDALIKNNIKLCLLSINLESENKIVEKNKEFINQGGIFASIFKASEIYIDKRNLK